VPKRLRAARQLFDGQLLADLQLHDLRIGSEI